MVTIPEYIKNVGNKLISNGYAAYLVGGCVRDLAAGKKPTDWDVSTSATPKEIQTIFPDSFYENSFGTVGVKIRAGNESFDKNASEIEERDVIDIVEITPHRIEEKYSNARHPDSVTFSKKIEDDLKRRDFTINALALGIDKLDGLSKVSEKRVTDIGILDPYRGLQDLENKLIRAVGNPNERFQEDALRLVRAVRFSAQLKFEIEEKTFAAIKENSHLLQKISQERIRDELIRIIKSEHPSEGIEALGKAGLLKYVLPELESGVGVSQNKHHTYTVYRHSLMSLKYCPSKKLSVRLAALLHDVAKPKVKQGEGTDSTFYNHDLVGARVAEQALKRMRFPVDIIKKTTLLVKNHMFHYDVGSVSESSVRRLVRKVGRENIKDLIDLRIADRLGSGCPKAKPYKLRHLEYLIEKVAKDPISVKMLKIDGNVLNKEAGVEKGPKMGMILDILLSEVIENPKLNKTEYLLKRARELSGEKAEQLREKAKQVIEEKKVEEDKVIRQKHWVS